MDKSESVNEQSPKDSKKDKEKSVLPIRKDSKKQSPSNWYKELSPYECWSMEGSS